MFDAAPSYYEAFTVDETDSEVVDDPDVPSIAIGRVVTAELTMQVLVFARWHRRLPDADRTSCGVPFRIVTTAHRRETLATYAVGSQPAAPLCSDCFTPHELTHALANDRKQLERELEEDRKRNEEFFAPRRKRPSNQGDR